MTNFDRFKQAFDEMYLNNIYNFIYSNSIPFGGKVVEFENDIIYDSYGNENSNIYKIYYFEDFDVYIKFSGYRASYSGEDWYNSYQEVKPVEKTIKTYESL